MRRRDFLIATGAAFGLAACRGMVSGLGIQTHAWGESGNRNGQFRRPRAVGVRKDEVFVIDMTGRVQVFDRDGAFLRAWSTPDASNGTPTCVTFSPRGPVLVPDTHYNRIIEYSDDGAILAMWGEYGTKPGQFIYPTGIAEDRDGTFYVSEYGVDAERVQVFDADHNAVDHWGGFGEGEGQFNRAMDLKLGPDGNVYVVDTANHRIQCFSTAGDYLHSVSGLGNEKAAIEFPYDAAFAPDGTVLVCEYGNNRVSRFTAAGAFINAYGSVGRGPGQFNGPRGLDVDDDGNVYVADTDNDRIQRFALESAA